ncbi:carbonate dehydratase [Blastopirellula sp. JC732]|uniref:Carbonic anhydrase n=1 Tax=Blastopirellula sediminis TaxID=2894196 RepID=A0A9X1MP12_9BACT|nr:carbonate dehydratase [Blastopirellula sediminis]MCC9606411.1 carbonate dehydratase [Blastopirellula sediminis]MCC9630291.1 carbonate dehydratase [Blastopirellula sediminis]
MRLLPQLMANNRAWAESVLKEDPEFFAHLAKGQKPEILWIGCADSRVPANQIIGLKPGDVFVHRNIANVVVHSDFNCQSVIEYAVSVLRVKHIIVCGHYSCGGVKAAAEDHHVGLIDGWLRHIRDVRQKHDDLLQRISSDEKRIDRLCELNVVEQALNVSHSTVVQEAWAHGQQLAVHGWIYSINNGLINDLNVTIDSPSEIATAYRVAVDHDHHA